MTDFTVHDILILTERILRTRPESLAEPTVTLDRLPGYRAVRNMTETQKVMYDLRTRLIREAKGWIGLGKKAEAEGDEERAKTTTENLENTTAIIVLLDKLLRRSCQQQGISDLFQDVEFVAGWKIAVGPKLGDGRPDSDGTDQAVVAADLSLKAIDRGLQGIGRPFGRPKKNEGLPN